MSITLSVVKVDLSSNVKQGLRSTRLGCSSPCMLGTHIEVAYASFEGYNGC